MIELEFFSVNLNKTDSQTPHLNNKSSRVTGFILILCKKKKQNLKTFISFLHLQGNRDKYDTGINK